MKTDINSIWYGICEDVWDKKLVIDKDTLPISTLAVSRWFSQRGLRVSNGSIMLITERLMHMLDEGDFHYQRYGEAPEVHIEAMDAPSLITQHDKTVLQSMTPDILEEAGGEAGFDMHVFGTNGHHPLDKWDY